MAPPAGGSKHFSTSAPRQWQYATSAALRIAAPRLLKKKEQTRVSMRSETAGAPMPIALRFCPLPNIALPDISKNPAVRQRLSELVDPVPAMEDQVTMKNEKDVIAETGPYFFRIVRALAPHVLASYNFTGVLEWNSDVPMAGSKPDMVLKYNGKDALVLDFKGPNCMREDRLRGLGASSVGSAQARLASEKATSLVQLAKQDERAIILQGTKYAQETRAPIILFYDYDYIFAMEPTRDLIHRKPNVLLDVVLFREPAKSTGSQLVNLEENHVTLFLKYILKAVSRMAAS